MGPGKQRELAHIEALLERKHEPHKAGDVHDEADEAVMDHEVMEELLKRRELNEIKFATFQSLTSFCSTVDQ